MNLIPNLIIKSEPKVIAVELILLSDSKRWAYMLLLHSKAQSCQSRPHSNASRTQRFISEVQWKAQKQNWGIFAVLLLCNSSLLNIFLWLTHGSWLSSDSKDNCFYYHLSTLPRKVRPLIVVGSNACPLILIVFTGHMLFKVFPAMQITLIPSIFSGNGEMYTIYSWMMIV